jgi:hypothetical protein
MSATGSGADRAWAAGPKDPRMANPINDIRSIEPTGLLA